MGKLLYGSPPVPFTFEDRTLLHVQQAILTKLRRGESFALVLDNDPAAGRGRHTLWIHPSVPLTFSLTERSTAPINPDWVRALLAEANSARGLSVIPEPARTAGPGSGRASM